MIYSYSKRIPRCKPLNAASFHRDGLTEKAIEDLLASNPGLLFSNPEDVLLVGRQRHGSRLPDLLFLDGARNLYVVEIKRDSADRTCVPQVQEYGARLGDWTREDFEKLWKGLHRKTPLAKGLRDHLGFGLTEPIARNVKLVIVAQSPGPGIADLIRLAAREWPVHTLRPIRAIPPRPTPVLRDDPHSRQPRGSRNLE